MGADGRVVVDDSGLLLELEDNRARLQSLVARLRFQVNELERLNRLAANNNAAVNQIDQSKAELDMTTQEIRRAEVAVAQVERRIALSHVAAPFSGVVAERPRNSATTSPRWLTTRTE